MTLDGLLNIRGEVPVDHGGRIFRQQCNALRDCPALRTRRVNDSNGQIATFDYNFCPRPHSRKQANEIPRCVRF